MLIVFACRENLLKFCINLLTLNSNTQTLFASKAHKKNPPTLEAVIKAIISCSIKIRQLTHKLDFIFAAQNIFVLA